MDDDIRRDALEDLNRTYAWLRGYTTVKPWAFDLRLAMDELEAIQGEGVGWSVDQRQPATCTILKERKGLAVEFKAVAESLPEAIMKALVRYFEHTAPRDEG
ncbi:hypothetical protein [Aggregatilinea lenta]|uniref:hypothetical protein n=1 Tax=Aggregatilinea lenta TaxID=913108 RepID=UPI000E5C11FC|nr:hypothetical protein [Aggregatilinea lenta]